MARRKLEQNNIRKLTKIGGKSFGITLPILAIRKLRWREKQKLVVKVRGKKVTIEDWPARGPASTRNRGERGEKK